MSDQTPRRGVPRWLTIAVLQVTALIVAGSTIHVPMHSLSPGRTSDVLSNIKVRGTQTFPSDGKLLLTTASVSLSPLTVWEALYVWIDPGISTVPRAFLVPPGSSDAEQDIQNRRDIEESKIVAAVAAFRALGYPVPVQRGATILTVLQDTPADGVLRPRDRVLAVDGRVTRDPAAFSRQVQDRRPGARVLVRFQRAGRVREVELRTADVDGRATVGVTLGPAYRFPNDVAIDSEDIVGPSGGLVFALSIADVLTRDDLTRGHTIGVTGVIELDERGRGVVRPIGAVQEKVRGAWRDGATVFVVPIGEEREARSVAPDGLEVVGVRTLAQAIAKLRRLPALEGRA